MRFIGFYDYTVILTYLSVLSALLGMGLSFQGRFGAAILCLMASGLCDGFDGTVARSKKNRTEDEKAFGIQIDSLCDSISFGVFPAVLSYCMGLSGVLGIAICMLYALCAVIRLGFFNVLEANRQKTESGSNKMYRGMPVTTISMLLPAVFLLNYLLSPGAFAAVLHVLMAASAFLFVLDFSMKKPDWMALFRKKK